MFSTPKSASILFGIGDARVQSAVRRAQREAVAEALGYLESTAARGRLGAGGMAGWFQGPGFLAAAFEHRTSRAGDPQLHTHVLVANAVQRPDGRWAAPDGRLLYAEAKTAGYVHEAAFRRALSRELGVTWERVVNGIADVEGVSEEAVRAFSRRRREIEAHVAELGRSGAASRQVAAVRTREAKDYRITPERLSAEWKLRAGELGLTRERVLELLDRRPYRALDAPALEAIADQLGLRGG